ncbi:hypothetical protein KY290_012910 [Solanum tuberosum]|uniref:Uncharacterized protein n=1 Tax=Solanum tuberosum TaxID=4113 RepID=A0ABQ7VMF7_SOLTU|nr:hypothetical protein KY285_015114 [Solanum tuberosum]KAH0768929.1 hypothetical protein KY290_012910 [Solanum tuberosum]
MAREPLMELPTTSNETQSKRQDDGNKTHPSTLSNSSHNSTNSQNTNAINTAFSVKELEGTRKIISPRVNALIREKVIGNMECTSLGLQHSQKSIDSTFPIDSNREAIFARVANESPEMHLQFWDTSSQICENSATRYYFPIEKVHLTEISSKMDGGIIGGNDFGVIRAQLTRVHEEYGVGNNSSPMDTHLSEISSKLDGGTATNENSDQSNGTLMNWSKGTCHNTQNLERDNSSSVPQTNIKLQLGRNREDTSSIPMMEADNSMKELNVIK